MCFARREFNARSVPPAVARNSRAFGVLLPALLGFALLLPGPSQAATFATTCNTATQVGDAASLIAAIDSANAAAGADTITLVQGCVYTIPAPPPNDGTHDKYYQYGPSGLPAIASDITIIGNGATITREPNAKAPYSPSLTVPYRLFFVSPAPRKQATLHFSSLGAGALTLRNLALRNGLAKGNGGGAGFGGAIFNLGALTLDAVTLTKNIARGGSPNSSDGYYGNGNGLNTAPVDFGSAVDGVGAAGYSAVGPDTAPVPGGRVGFGGYNARGYCEVTGYPPPYGYPFYEGGDARGSGGGFGGAGGYGTGDESGRCSHADEEGGTYDTPGYGGPGGFGGGGGAGYGLLSSLQDDSAGGPSGFGGGNGYVDHTNYLSAAGAGAGMGGAIFNFLGTLTATNCTFTANQVISGIGDSRYPETDGQGLGGAIFNLDGNVVLLFSTLAGNTADAGGALYNLTYLITSPHNAQATLTGSILAKSTAAAGGPIEDLVNNGGTVTGSIDLVGLASGSSLPAFALGGDPLLDSILASNGAAAAPQTLALLPGSPAIDFPGTSGFSIPVTDERGIPRPRGSSRDLGAFEFDPSTSDTTPNAFAFTDQPSVPRGAVVLSNAVAMTGINAPAPISISGDGSARYCVNGGACTSAAGYVHAGDSVRLQLTASATPAAQVSARLSVGGVKALFRVTAVACAGNFAFKTRGSAGAVFKTTETSGSALITVSRLGGSCAAVAVRYTTTPGTAQNSVNFGKSTGTLRWADGDAADKTFSVPVYDDRVYTSTLSAGLSLSTPTGGAALGSPATGMLNISNVDPAPKVELSPANKVVTKGTDGTVTVTATLSGKNGADSRLTFTFTGSAKLSRDYAFGTDSTGHPVNTPS